jgi:hypothetical protein
VEAATVQRRVEVAYQPDRLIFAGFLASLGESIVYLVAPVLGSPRSEVASLLGSAFIGEKLHTDPNAILMLGLLAQFVLGAIVIALLYPRFFPYLPFHGVVRGASLGVILWLIAGIVGFPLLGAGFFAINHGLAGPIFSLIGHVVYGMILAGIYGHPVPGEDY